MKLRLPGNGQPGFVSDGGPADATSLNYPATVAVDGAGNLYIGDGHNQRVRKVTPSGIITTVAGNGIAGYIADGGPAVGQQLYYPYGVAVAPSGDLYIADAGNQRVRKVFGAATMTPPPHPSPTCTASLSCSSPSRAVRSSTSAPASTTAAPPSPAENTSRSCSPWPTAWKAPGRPTDGA
ncbi:hypothetical protein ACIQVL_49350 [Streptomyces sp. NPDC090499]|uniref:hypothetical protein n=1 Tax=Streptomyces sp. NPDC090499 TaxID=3365965 RepID=UPI00381C4309